MPRQVLPPWWNTGFAVPDAEWRQMQLRGQYHLTYDKACRILARREHFTQELRRKLNDRSIEAAVIDDVLKKCAEQGFLNERRAAELNCEQLTAKSSIGAPKLRGELLKRGCERQLADEMVDRFCGEIDSFSAALDLLEKRRHNFESRLQQYQRKLAEKKSGRQLEMELRSKLSASMLSYLAGRGFGDSEARQAVREFYDRLLADSDA